jgi:hypothetical protein
LNHHKKVIAPILAVLIACPIQLLGQDTTSMPPAPSQPTQANAEVPKPHPLAVKRNSEGNLIVEEGTPLRLRLNRNLSSAEAKTGDRVDFEVLDPVKLGDTVVVEQGALAWATITDAEHKKTMGRAGKLNVNIDAAQMANGEKINLRAQKEAKGGGHVGAMTGAIVATSIVFFPAAPLFLFMHGKDITIPKGTEIIAYVNGDTVFSPLVPIPSTSAKTILSSSVTADLDINSTPDGAEIEIDGAFAGDTPSVVNVASGDHSVSLSKKGYSSWQKKVHVSSGKITIKAELEKSPQ